MGRHVTILLAAVLLAQVLLPSAASTSAPPASITPALPTGIMDAPPAQLSPDTPAVTQTLRLARPNLDEVQVPELSILNPQDADVVQKGTIVPAHPQADTTQASLLELLLRHVQELPAPAPSAAAAPPQASGASSASTLNLMLPPQPFFQISSTRGACIRQATATVGVPTILDVDCTTSTGANTPTTAGAFGGDVEITLNVASTLNGANVPSAEYKLQVQRLAQPSDGATVGVSLDFVHAPLVIQDAPPSARFTINASTNSTPIALPDFLNLTLTQTTAPSGYDVNLETTGSPGLGLGVATNDPINPTRISATLQPLPTQASITWTNGRILGWTASQTIDASVRIQSTSTLVVLAQGVPQALTLDAPTSGPFTYQASARMTRMDLNQTQGSDVTHVVATSLPQNLTLSTSNDASFSYAADSILPSLEINGNRKSMAFDAAITGVPTTVALVNASTPGNTKYVLTTSATTPSATLSIDDASGIFGSPFHSLRANLSNMPTRIELSAQQNASGRVLMTNGPLGRLELHLTEATTTLTRPDDFIHVNNINGSRAVDLVLTNLVEAAFTTNANGNSSATLERATSAPMFIFSEANGQWLTATIPTLPTRIAATIAQPYGFSYSAAASIPTLSVQGAAGTLNFSLDATNLPASISITPRSTPGSFGADVKASDTTDHVVIHLQDPTGVFASNYTHADFALDAIPTQLNLMSVNTPASVTLTAPNGPLGGLSMQLSRGFAVVLAGQHVAVIDGTSPSVSVNVTSLRTASATLQSNGTVDFTLNRDTPGPFTLLYSAPTTWTRVDVPTLPAQVSGSIAGMQKIRIDTDTPTPSIHAFGGKDNITFDALATSLPTHLNLTFTTSSAGVSATLNDSSTIGSVNITATNSSGTIAGPYATLDLHFTGIPAQVQLSSNFSTQKSVNFTASAPLTSAILVMSNGSALAYSTGDYVVVYDTASLKFLTARLTGVQSAVASIGETTQRVNVSGTGGQSVNVYYRGIRSTGDPGYAVAHVSNLPSQANVSMTTTGTCNPSTDPTPDPMYGPLSPGCVRFSTSAPVNSIVVYTNLHAGKLIYIDARTVPSFTFSWNFGQGSLGYAYLDGQATSAMNVDDILVVDDLSTSRYWYGYGITLASITLTYREVPVTGLNDRDVQIDTKGKTATIGYLVNPSANSFSMSAGLLTARNWDLYIEPISGLCIFAHINTYRSGQLGYARGSINGNANSVCLGDYSFKLDGFNAGAPTVAGDGTRTYQVIQQDGTAYAWSTVTAQLVDANGAITAPTSFTKPSGNIAVNDFISVRATGVYDLQLLQNGTVFWERMFGTTPVTQNDAGSFGDAPATTTGAISLTRGTYRGVLSPSSDASDTYAIWVTQGDLLRVGVTMPNTPSDVYLDILNTTGVIVSSSHRTGTLAQAASYLAPVSGVYFAQITSPGTVPAFYDVSISGASSASAARYATFATDYTSQVTQGQDSPRVEFVVPPNTQWVRVTLNMPSGTDFDLSVWNDQSNRVGGWTSTESHDAALSGATYSGDGTSPEVIQFSPVPQSSRPLPGDPSCGDSTGQTNGPGCGDRWTTGAYAFSGSGSFMIHIEINTLT